MAKSKAKAKQPAPKTKRVRRVRAECPAGCGAFATILSYPPTFDIWETDFCPRCTMHIKRDFKMTPGGAYYLKDTMEVGPFDVVEVGEDVAARCGDALRVKYIDEQLHAVWQDPETERWYAQPVEEAPGADEPR